MTSVSSAAFFPRGPLEGVELEELPGGARIEVQTENNRYKIEHRGDGFVLISGHPKFFPEPTLVRLNGSTWGGSAIKVGFIGHGMHLEFCRPRRGIVTTSRVLEISTPN